MDALTQPQLRQLITDLAKEMDLSVVEAHRWLSAGSQYRSGGGVSTDHRAPLITACAEMANAALRMAEFHRGSWELALQEWRRRQDKT